MKRCTLQQLSKSITSGITPFRGNPEFWLNGTIPWLKTEQLGERDIYETNEKITEEALSKTSIKLNPANTISIAMYGEGKTRGNVSILRKEMTTNQACCNVVLDQSLADCDYVYYFLKNQYLNLRSLSSGVRKNLNSGDIKGFTIHLPDTVDQQKKIAAVLSALDSKIALNHRINAELEGMAKLLYDYWFVQYDFPLSAAQAAALGKPHLTGKPYRTSGGPMVYDTQLKREIPQGWEVGDLEELCSMVRGVTYSKEDIRTPTDTNTISILRATNVNNGIVDLSDLVYVTEDMPSEDQYLEKFDILVVMSSGSKAHVGKNALYCYDQKVAYGAFCSKVVPNPSSRFFVAVHMQSDPFKKYISNVCRGTSINNLTNVHITKHQLPIPPKDQLQEFEKTVSSFFETIACNHQQNQELTTLRDWLLPMLMNGQVRVGDI